MGDRRGVNAPASERDERDQQLGRLGLFLVVYTDRFVHAVAAALRIGHSAVKQVVPASDRHTAITSIDVSAAPALLHRPSKRRADND
jgi:hypothetical protein